MYDGHGTHAGIDTAIFSEVSAITCSVTVVAGDCNLNRYAINYNNTATKASTNICVFGGLSSDAVLVGSACVVALAKSFVGSCCGSVAGFSDNDGADAGADIGINKLGLMLILVL